MDVLKWSERLMGMDEKAWARHSNPWSVYSRFTALPLISVAFYSREWLGLYALLPIVLALFWVWVNPRVFEAPEKTDNWASMGTFGERIYLNRAHEHLPEHHLRVCRLLQLLSVLGVPFFLYGLVVLDFWVLVLGNIWIMVFKTWFVDRMVWLYRDMKDSNPRYQAWLKS